MKDKIINFFAYLILIIGLSLLAYPTVSNYINTQRQRRAIYNYIQEIETISDDEYERILAEAAAYNEKLAQRQLYFTLYDEEMREEYFRLLDLTGTGIMANIMIEKANIYLPIYHTSSEGVLQIGVGHMEGSSLPVGGETAHTLLTGHRGLPAALLFTNLDKLDVGDTFTLMVLNEPFIYEVDQIVTILPDRGDILRFESGEDYCTLITCTPYGVNTHRLLVRGKRLELTEEEKKLSIQSGGKMVSNVWLLAIVELPVLLISAIAATNMERKRMHHK